MDEHGCSTLPTDETGRILDRLAGLEKRESVTKASENDGGKPRRLL